MSLILTDPSRTIDQAVAFIQQTFANNHKQKAVIAVSGGIDSALSLALVCKALGPENVTALFLPYDTQDMTDAVSVVEQLNIPQENRHIYNIKPVVEAAKEVVGLSSSSDSQQSPASDNDRLRQGNLMARSRMILVFDTAKKLDALVCGTENKSEHFLGYFTRFGDAASDLEPISHLYKTQVRQLAAALNLPESIRTKAPSAGLWTAQTDEEELGFTYELADKVLDVLIDQQHVDFLSLQSEQDWQNLASQTVEGVTVEQIQHVLEQIKSSLFKLKVPYEYVD